MSYPWPRDADMQKIQELQNELTDAKVELERLRLNEGALLNVREENERLREENYDVAAQLGAAAQELERLRQLFTEAESHRDYWKNRETKRTAAMEAELERLREENNDLRMRVSVRDDIIGQHYLDAPK